MSTVFQTLINQLREATGTDALRQAMSNFADSYGLGKFTYGFSGQGLRQPVFISTYPGEWAQHYLSQRYYEIDPVVAQARGLLPFEWNSLSPAPPVSSRQRRLFREATDFGLNCGFTVPIHDSYGRVGAVSFASDRTIDVLRRDLDSYRNILHLAAMYFHVHARQKLDGVIELNRPHLSPREIACLQWIARGKNTWDIGEILGVSRRTVVFHLENAKRKLNVHTLPQAVAVALQDRLIEF
jgi:LuxR family transcriptional regulator, activator of conjugal transfer of Ti plasmids